MKFYIYLTVVLVFCASNVDVNAGKITENNPEVLGSILQAAGKKTHAGLRSYQKHMIVGAYKENSTNMKRFFEALDKQQDPKKGLLGRQIKAAKEEFALKANNKICLKGEGEAPYSNRTQFEAEFSQGDTEIKAVLASQLRNNELTIIFSDKRGVNDFYTLKLFVSKAGLRPLGLESLENGQIAKCNLYTTKHELECAQFSSYLTKYSLQTLESLVMTFFGVKGMADYSLSRLTNLIEEMVD